jgi:hypothetical protein
LPRDRRANSCATVTRGRNAYPHAGIDHGVQIRGGGCGWTRSPTRSPAAVGGQLSLPAPLHPSPPPGHAGPQGGVEHLEALYDLTLYLALWSPPERDRVRPQPAAAARQRGAGREQAPGEASPRERRPQAGLRRRGDDGAPPPASRRRLRPGLPKTTRLHDLRHPPPPGFSTRASRCRRSVLGSATPRTASPSTSTADGCRTPTASPPR